MKTTPYLLCMAALGLAAPQLATAQERARVLSSTAVMQQVGMPQQVCAPEQVYQGQRTDGTGAVIGAVIGGVLGNTIARGSHYQRGPYGHMHRTDGNRTAGTVIGAVAGGLIGNHVEGRNGGTPEYRTVNRCENEVLYENRIVGYDVTYEYAGRRYTTRMDYDPGAWVPVRTNGAVGSAHTYSSSPSPATGYYPGGRVTQTQPHTPPSANTGQFVGPTGVYSSAPPGVPSVRSIEYNDPYAQPPIIVDIHPPRYGYGYDGRPLPQPRGY